MAQHDYIISNATFPATRTDINNALSAIQTTNSGTSLPTGAVAGQIWLDTTGTPTANTLKFYDGTDSISLATINYTANTVDWLDSSITITGLSTTATATVLTLSDSANTTTVNLIIDNQKEIRFRETTANGTNYVALKAPASLSADLTFTLPTADGTSGQALVTNGSGVLSFTTISADGTVDWDTTVKTSGFTATANKGYFCNTTSAAFTVTLPTSPSAGDEIVIVDYAGTFATNNLTITATPKINASTDDVTLTTNREATRLVYIDATQGYIAYSGVNEGTAPSLTDVPPTYSIDFLVVAGGGGGGGNVGGGGGAGGYRTSTQTVSSSTVITVTVGDGGAGGANEIGGTQASSSSISGSGLTTITSAGGGGGSARTAGANDGGTTGGSGGGGAGGSSGSFAGFAGNTPSTSPSQGSTGGTGNNSGTISGGGGGGASAVGANASNGQGGNGGAGSASSITGLSVTYAGGGGGGCQTTIGTGGSGGGGNGGTNGVNGVNGTANLGGGGGGGGNGFSGGTGGKGVVILSVPTANYSSTSTGAPTVTTSGANTILQFNGTGSYTS